MTQLLDQLLLAQILIPGDLVSCAFVNYLAASTVCVVIKVLPGLLHRNQNANSMCGTLI